MLGGGLLDVGPDEVEGWLAGVEELACDDVEAAALLGAAEVPVPGSVVDFEVHPATRNTASIRATTKRTMQQAGLDVLKLMVMFLPG